MNKSALRNIVIVVVLLAVLAVILAFLFKPKVRSSQAVSIPTADQPMLGKPNAKIKIVVFEDLKCIACKIFNNSVMPKIKQTYIDPGIANYTVINLAFIPGSMPAANAARCLYQDNPQWFFTFVDYVYQNQPPEQLDWATIPKLVEFASHSIPEVDKQKLSRCIYESPHTDFIEKNFEIAKKAIGETVMTPSIFINGHLAPEPSWKQIHDMIAAETKK